MHSRSTSYLTPMRNRLLSTAVAAAVICFSMPTLADEETETYDSIIVENAFVEVKGTTAPLRLKFDISNLSSSVLTLEGVRTDRFEKANLYMRLPGKGVVEVDSLTILKEETLELGSSHIVVELRTPNRAFKPGEKIEFELLFSDRIVRAIADIHSSKT